ncbi:membrane dipeptidase [Aquibium sp. A9E412]|uniref:dipeptidase n=1 Tax=Aquibium sp. A9E412 TaxID=2976767 RepID=UPI0025B03250|nr:membrane dipeptidase [Aquibium sp. A9E412]MDN2565060.1 membrane dipeptidase [Aquibium sp. A9E412]
MLIDGLQCGHFNRSSFEELKTAGVTCVTVTCGFWEGALDSLDSIARWRDLVRANADIALIASGVADIRRADAEGKVAVLLGFQNTNCLQGRIRFVELFAELGTRVLQLTYNNQNELGGSCYEEHDSGLARFGREVITEMNRSGMLVDLSHVGDRTTLDAIRWSKKPVAVTHANPKSVFDHRRNKSDEVLRALRDTGGVIGCATYRNIVGDEHCQTVEAWAGLVARAVDIAGIDHVAFGTDTNHNKVVPDDLDWMRKGYWTRGEDFGAGSAARPGAVPPPSWYQRPSQLSVLRQGLVSFGFNDEEADKIAFGNWLRLYGEVFG